MLGVAHYDTLGLPTPKVSGHVGKMCFARVAGRDVILMAGRSHCYETDVQDVVLGVRALAKFGVEIFILSSATGAVNQHYRPGDIVLVKDILLGDGAPNPCMGEADPWFGPRFFSMSDAFSAELRAHVQEVAQRIGGGIGLNEGVLGWNLGPNYETPAQIRKMRNDGCDLAGMSGAEAFALAEMRRRLVWLSCVTNMGAGMTEGAINHEEVEAVGKQASERFGRLVTAIIGALP